jgi:predicted ester cyclase
MLEKASQSGRREHMTQSEEHRSLYLSYLEYCNEHDSDRMASFIHRPSRSTTSLWIQPPLRRNSRLCSPHFLTGIGRYGTSFVDGDNIAVHFTVTGTHRGAFQGIEATGRRVTISEFTFYRLEDGKFAEVWDHADMDAAMRQIGQGEAHPG